MKEKIKKDNTNEQRKEPLSWEEIEPPEEIHSQKEVKKLKQTKAVKKISIILLLILLFALTSAYSFKAGADYKNHYFQKYINDIENCQKQASALLKSEFESAEEGLEVLFRAWQVMADCYDNAIKTNPGIKLRKSE